MIITKRWNKKIKTLYQSCLLNDQIDELYDATNSNINESNETFKGVIMDAAKKAGAIKLKKPQKLTYLHRLCFIFLIMQYYLFYYMAVKSGDMRTLNKSRYFIKIF